MLYIYTLAQATAHEVVIPPRSSPSHEIRPYAGNLASEGPRLLVVYGWICQGGLRDLQRCQISLRGI